MRRFFVFLSAAMFVIGGGAALGLSGTGPKSTHARPGHANAPGKKCHCRRGPRGPRGPAGPRGATGPAGDGTVTRFHKAVELGTGLHAVSFGHGLSVEMVCSTFLTLRFRSTGEDGIIGVTATRATGGAQDDNTLTPIGPTTTDNTLSATDTDFDRNEALFVAGGTANNSSITGSFTYNGTDGSVITGDFIGAFITAHGGCDLAGNAVVSTRRPRSRSSSR